MTLNNSKSAQMTISNLAKYARLSLLFGVSILATLLLFIETESLSNFILSKIAAGVFFLVIYGVAKHWDSKNLLPQL